MSATATPVASDRSDFRTVTVGGAKLGVATAVAVVAFLAASQRVPITGGLRGGVEALIVLAAAVGLVATVVFSAIDIVLLRPFKAYPWTWDAIGGGSTWWYLPIWWMLGTFLAWMGGIVTAAGGEATLGRRALPALAATIVVALIVRLAGVTLALPVATGGAFTLVLAALVLVGWLLTPVLAWSASYIGLWAGALVATGFTRPVTMLIVAGAVATLCGFTALFIWVRFMRRVPPLLF